MLDARSRFTSQSGNLHRQLCQRNCSLSCRFTKIFDCIYWSHRCSKGPGQAGGLASRTILKTRVMVAALSHNDSNADISRSKFADAHTHGRQYVKSSIGLSSCSETAWITFDPVG